jgi:hypothetical protein
VWAGFLTGTRLRKSWPHRGQKSEPSGTCAPQFGQVKSPACG